MFNPAKSVQSPRAVNIEDLRRLAKKRVPKAVFDYLDGGADEERTLRENGRAFQEITFRPRVAVEVKNCDLRVRILGHELSFPAILAPVGYSRLMHPGGEVAAARAAGKSGTGYILSTISVLTPEAIRLRHCSRLSCYIACTVMLSMQVDRKFLPDCSSVRCDRGLK